ncbi:MULTISPECIES: hypothetical protein [unclassified Pseudomonas]|uniref:hypothetical protein n=1 Tax=unclassified Pseudomonas TaxID=196821 RepID=UPI001179B84D
MRLETRCNLADGVAFSVRQLADKLQSQLAAAAQIVSNAEVMITSSGNQRQQNAKIAAFASVYHNLVALPKAAIFFRQSTLH